MSIDIVSYKWNIIHINSWYHIRWHSRVKSSTQRSTLFFSTRSFIKHLASSLNFQHKDSPLIVKLHIQQHTEPTPETPYRVCRKSLLHSQRVRTRLTSHYGRLTRVYIYWLARPLRKRLYRPGGGSSLSSRCAFQRRRPLCAQQIFFSLPSNPIS